MKNTNVSDHFKTAIETHLKEFADNDNLFAEAFYSPNKNIDDCITYVLNVVMKSGISGYTRDEIFSMAIHYYDEDNIDVGNPIMNCQVVVSHRIELIEEQKAQNHKQKTANPSSSSDSSIVTQSTLF